MPSFGYEEVKPQTCGAAERELARAAGVVLSRTARPGINKNNDVCMHFITREERVRACAKGLGGARVKWRLV